MEKDTTLDQLLEGVDNFAKAMKERLIERAGKGKKGWQDVSPRNAQYKAKKALVRIMEGQSDADVDAANWLAIHHINRTA